MKTVRRILAILYAGFVVYYTVLCREPGTELIFKPLFWELSRGAWRDIGLNILLFVPLGFLLGDKKGVLIGFLLSTIIEFVQLIFRLGFCEMDDVLNNTIGTVVGVGLFYILQRLTERIKNRYLRTGKRSKNILKEENDMYIIIGASSFIGVYTADEFLKQGCEVIVTGRKNRFKEHYDKLGVKYVNLDLTNEADFEQLPKDGVEGVILLSGLLPANAEVNLDVDENAADYFRINTIGTINVLEYCRKNGIKRVISNCSYADVCGAWGKKVITEDEPRDFIYKGDHAVYVFSKNAANDTMEYYNQQHGMKNAWFRFPPVYGVGPHDSLFINGVLKKSGLKIFIDNASEGKDICIFGNPHLSRDVVYVKDVAHAFYLAMKSENTYGLYNMTSGRGVTLQEQAEVISELWAPSSDKRSKITYRPEVQNNTPSYLFSMEKAKRDFGFVPAYADFKVMMADYKKDLDANRYQELFHYVK